MAEFSAAAELEVSVNRQSLTNARRQIENDLGDIEVGLAPSGRGGGAIGSRGPESPSIDLSRRQLNEQQELVELAQTRNELLEDLSGAGGGGGGGGGLGFGALGIGLALLGSRAPFFPGVFGRGGAVTPGPGGDSTAGVDSILGLAGFDPAGPRVPRPGPLELERRNVQENNPLFGFSPTELERRNVQENNPTNVNLRTQIDVSGASERRMEQILKRRIDEFRTQIEADLANELGAGTGPRRGTAFQAKGNPFRSGGGF